MALNDIASLFPASRRETYFNSAGATLMPEPVRAEAAGFLDALVRDNVQAFMQYRPRVARLRENLAEMMGGTVAEIAITHHTAEGASVIANGIDWREGDTILTLDREYPSTVYPWMNAARRYGVALEFLHEEGGRVAEETIAEEIRKRRPRLFAISAVEWCSGYRFDLREIGRACREAGTFFFVDSAQSLGFWEMDVRGCHVSAMAGSAWKWLFGPPGQGYLYMRHGAMGEISPAFVGSESVVDAQSELDYALTFLPDMRRFEYSTSDLAAQVWFDAGVRFLRELGLGEVRAHVFDLQDRAIEELRAIGCELRGDLPREKRSGIMAFRLPDVDSGDLSHRLAREADILTRERDGFVRLAFHVTNTEEGLGRLLEFLRGLS